MKIRELIEKLEDISNYDVLNKDVKINFQGFNLIVLDACINSNTEEVTIETELILWVSL